MNYTSFDQLASVALKLAEHHSIPDVITALGRYLERRGRSRDLPWLRAALTRQRELSQSIVVWTAEEVTADLKQMARNEIPGITFQIDPALLGGILIRQGSSVYDGSLRTTLRQLTDYLKEES